jgi:hypothetical protein
MQTTSSGYSSVVNAPFRQLTTGVLLSWLKTLASNINFFTINTSLIAGNDIIKGSSGDSVSFFDKYQYSDYATYVKNWSVDRQIGQFPFGLIMAQADVELDNTSDLFTPNYDATIGSGILPNRPLKINLAMGQDSLLQFTGFTGQPEIDVRGRSMLLHAYDVIDVINNYTFTSQSGTTFSGMLTNVTTASAIQYYLGKIGFNANQYQLEASLQQPIGVVNVTDRKFGDVLRDLVEAEVGIMLADETGIIKFWNRQHFVTTSGLGYLFNITPSNAVDIKYANAPIINDVTVTAKPRAIGPFQRVWNQGSYQTVQPGQSLTVFADFSDEYGALPVTQTTTPSYSSTQLNTSYFSTNANTDGSGAALNAFITLTSTYLFGTTYKMVFTNTGGTTIYLTALELYGTPAKVLHEISQQYVDQASIDAYGRNPANNGETLPIDNNYIQSASDALALAFTLVSQYGQPNRHFTVEIFSNPALQIGDYGKLTLPSTGLTKTVWITGKTDKLNPEGNLVQILQLEERTLFTYFTINSSAIGGADVIAP